MGGDELGGLHVLELEICIRPGLLKPEIIHSVLSHAVEENGKKRKSLEKGGVWSRSHDIL